jgi:hypothetical protein
MIHAKELLDRLGRLSTCDFNSDVYRATRPSLDPLTPSTRGPAEPASLTDQPRLPVWALATMLLAHVSAFGLFDEILYLVEHRPHPFGLRPLPHPVAT